MQELVKILEDYVKENFNEDSIKVFRQLWGKSNVSEFDIAENLKLSINYVRNLLYGLHAGNLVSSTRKKDRQKGWYIYYWTFNLKHAVGVLLIRKKLRLEQLEKQLNKDAEEKYTCPDGHVEFNAVRALEHGFKCPECEQVLIRKSKEFDKELLIADIDNLKKEIETLNVPIEIPKEHVKVKKTVKKINKLKAKKRAIKKKIKKLKKKLKKVQPEKRKKLVKRIKRLKAKRKIIKKRIIAKKSSGKDKSNVKNDADKNKGKVKDKKGFLSLIKKRVGF